MLLQNKKQNLKLYFLNYDKNKIKAAKVNNSLKMKK